jgi:hypothetical protein
MVVIMNDELEMSWKEVVVAYFKALSQNMSGGEQVNHKDCNLRS